MSGSIRFTSKEVRRLVQIGVERFERTNKASGGFDPKSSYRAGRNLSIQGVFGEAAWFRVTQRSDEALNDTTPRSERKTTNLSHDSDRDDSILFDFGVRALVDVKTVVSNSNANALHIGPNKECDMSKFKSSEFERQTPKEKPPQTRNVYVLMAIRGFHGGTAEFDEKIHTSEEIDVELMGWIDDESLWQVTNGEVCNVANLYASAKRAKTDRPPAWRFVVPQCDLRPWKSYDDFYSHFLVKAANLPKDE